MSLPFPPRAPRQAFSRITFPALLATLAAPALAQVTLPTLTVMTPTRTALSLEDALPATTVITRDEIERWQAQDLVQLLSRQAGIEFAQSGGPGSQASLFVRGANSSGVLVLVDGVRINSVVGGAPALGGVALDTVERIEISRGNLSSLYGSNAVGGVIQVFTRAGSRNGGTVSVEAGQGRTLNASASLGYAEGGTRLGVALGSQRSRQFSAIDAARVIPGPWTPGANPDLDGQRNESATVSASHAFASGLRVAGQYWRSHNRVDFDSSADGPTAAHEEDGLQDAAALTLRLPLTARWTSELALGQSRENSSNRASDPFSFNNSHFESRNRQLSWQNDLELAPGFTGTAALEWLDQEGGSTGFDPNYANAYTVFERRVKSGWLALNGTAGSQQWQAALRRDDYSDAGAASTGLVAWGWKFAPDWKLALQASNAFRAPSFNDLYYPGSGNAALKPEKARSLEAAVSTSLAGWRVKATAYRTDSRDLIVYDAAANFVDNVARARSTGLELAANGRLGAWELAANASYVRPLDEANAQRLLRRAPWTYNTSAIYESGAWRAGGELGYVGPRWDSDINTYARTRLAAYPLARVVAAYKLDARWTLKARIENLFDRAYETVSGYHPQPRTALVGVEAKLF